MRKHDSPHRKMIPSVNFQKFLIFMAKEPILVVLSLVHRPLRSQRRENTEYAEMKLSAKCWTQKHIWTRLGRIIVSVPASEKQTVAKKYVTCKNF